MNNNKYKILVIEDEENINNLLIALLEASGYQAISAKSCQNGKMLFSSYKPDLVILDLGLPDFDGMLFLTDIRRNYGTPIIVLSARSDDKDKVGALDAGANDYVTKPFSSAELVARVRLALRNIRNGSFSSTSSSKFEADGLTIDYDARRVFIEKEEIKLT